MIRRLLLALVCGSALMGAAPIASAAMSESIPHVHWLVRHRNGATGLVQSFETRDHVLHHQGATYDQALAGMMFLQANDIKSARRILRFYQARWRGHGFPNFYHTKTGAPGIEVTIHVGPNAWIGLLALAYERHTGDTRYWRLAESIGAWIASLPHLKGAVVMGPRPDWGADWTTVISSENNLSYLALLDGLLTLHREDSSHVGRFESERAGIWRFLRTVTFADIDACRVNTGYNQDGVDHTQAFDVIPLAIMIVGPEKLQAMGVNPSRLAECGRRRFGVRHGTVRGFGFTDMRGAQAAQRARMVSVEWTAMMIRAYRVLAATIEGDHPFLTYATMLQGDLDQLRMTPMQPEACYPYATRSKTRVFPHSPWWKTPGDGPAGLACSVSGTVWRFFAEHWDPFDWDTADVAARARSAKNRTGSIFLKNRTGSIF